MQHQGWHIYTRVVARTLSGAVIGYVCLRAALSWSELSAVWPGLLLLSLGAMTCAQVANAYYRGPTIRLSLTFVLAALWLLPSPSALIVAALAGFVSRGGGLSGWSRRGLHALASTLVSVAVVDQFNATAQIADGQADLRCGLWLILFFLLIQTLGLALGRILEPEPKTPSTALDRDSRQAVGRELVNVPLAWLLASLYLAGLWHHVAVTALLIVGAAMVLVILSRTSWALRRTDRVLASRMRELDTLHTIGGEILSTLEPSRIFDAVDRACRATFDTDTTIIALSGQEDAPLRLAYRRVSSLDPELDSRLLEEPISHWVVRNRTSLRLDDRHGPEMGVDWPTEPHDRGMRSLIAAPLLANGRVTGVLSVRSKKRRAFDDRQLSVLGTIAQHAAVAIENARHFQAATIDSLTGFFLRDYFFRRLRDEYERSSRYGGKFSLLMLDLDGFKAINDQHGHMTGDRFLRSIAETIRDELRAADLTCRYGGDEFCLLLPETGIRGARTIAERIRRAVGDRVVVDDSLRLRTTVSIGLAVFPEHDQGGLESILRNSDMALYEAKRSGRDRVVPYAA